MKSRITFNGMNRYSPPNSAQPGDCTAIVNLRNQSNCLKPVGTPEYLYTPEKKNHWLVYVHICYDGEHHITENENTLYYEALIKKENGNIQKESSLLFELNDLQVLSIQSIGNTLIIICTESIYYLLYKEGKYIFLGEKPDIPEISFFPYIEYTDAYFVSEYTFQHGYSNPTRLDTEDINYYNDAYYNAFFQLQEKAWKRHYFIQPILIRYALTLYDGSRIFSSAPVMVSLPSPIQPYQMSIRLKNSNNLCLGSHEGQIIAGNYSLKYYIHQFNLDNWKDIVRSIDFFVSPEATIFEPDQKQQGLKFTIKRTEENETLSFLLKGDISFLDLKEIKKRYLQDSLFYKIATIEDWSDWKEGESYAIENKIRPDLLVHEEVLSPDNTTLLSTGAHVSYIHNKRLHIANLKKKLFPGFPLSLFNVGNKNAETVDAYICTYLKTERGECKVVWQGKSNYFFNQLSPLISYPDSNAYKMEIVVKSENTRYKGSFLLTASEYENRADYLNETLSAISLENDSLPASTPLDIPLSENDTYTQPNILRVSELENPFIFPSEQTYTISNGEITGIATITAALSEGQFGEFPLYVFTEEGIWALQNGNGIVCYGAQHQLNREPILPENPIVPLEDMIMFTTAKGLFIIRGSEIQQLLSFDETACENNSPIAHHDIDSTLIPATTDQTTLSQFIQGSIIAYNTIEKELICCRPDLKYSLIIHIPSLYRYRISQHYSSLFYDASHLLAQDAEGKVYDLQKESAEITPIALVSRPITLQSEEYQKWREVFWRLSMSEGKLLLSLWGGNDAEGNFSKICEISSASKVAGQLPMRFTGPAYKYFRLILCGNVSSDFHLSSVDIHSENIISNRLH